MIIIILIILIMIISSFWYRTKQQEKQRVVKGSVMATQWWGYGWRPWWSPSSEFVVENR